METRKLYYEDCMCASFSARVTACRETEQGWEVRLDVTAFYPEGGGQACDLGTLGGVQVLDVQERDDAVMHLCSGPLCVGETVTGEIDWPRRFDLMQQHTGEHIISGIIHQKYGYHNVGFHMGADVTTIDFDGPIPAEALAEIELAANQAVWRDTALQCWYPSPEELPNVPYRTKKALPWPVRIVEIPGVDKCACCGVHTARTGQVGLIKLISCVKFHQGVRLELVCGGRALSHIQAAYEQNRQVSQAFSAKLLETGAAARRMNEQLAAEKFRAVGLEKRLFAAIAREYAGQDLALHFEAGLNPAGIRELATQIAALGGTAAVFSPAETGFSFCLAGNPEQVKVLGANLTQTLSGRGGGKPGFFQGSVRAAREQIEKFFAATGHSV